MFSEGILQQFWLVCKCRLKLVKHLEGGFPPSRDRAEAVVLLDGGYAESLLEYLIGSHRPFGLKPSHIQVSLDIIGNW